MMTGIVICGHSGLALAFAQAAETICGAQKNLTAFDLHLNDDIEAYADSLRVQVQNWLHQGMEVWCLCDMAGGYPMEVCLTRLADLPVKVVTEISLTLLVTLLVSRTQDADSDTQLKLSLLEAKNAFRLVDLEVLFADKKGA